nr:hypothetical protein CFP56_06779 [Quercus suber]
MLESIIKDKDPDPCVGPTMGELRNSGLFDLAREALRTLNKEVKELKEKLEEEGRQRKKDQEAKETTKKELSALLGQVETIKVDVVKEFKELQAFIDSCAEYYGNATPEDADDATE